MSERWFNKRPQLSKRCERCHGCGTVVVEYALTPAEYVDGAPDGAILAFVVGAFDIFTACKEALDIARDSQRPVAFEFNGQCVVVSPSDDPVRVAQKWWLDQHGETYEQSVARR